MTRELTESPRVKLARRARDVPGNLVTISSSRPLSLYVWKRTTPGIVVRQTSVTGRENSEGDAATDSLNQVQRHKAVTDSLPVSSAPNANATTAK